MNFKLSAFRAKQADLPLIIEAARYGDSVAYNELISRCFQPVLRYCSNMGSPEDAHDLAQETFLRALKSKSLATDTTNLEAFMIYVAKHVCADYLREIKKARSLHTENRYPASKDGTNEVETEYVEYTELLAHLCLEMREAFILTQLMGFSYEDVSHISEVPIGTIRSRVSRARQELQTTYQSNYT